VFFLEQKLVLVSVIIPIYNAEMCLKACVESILSQTYMQIELLLVDDGSTDRSSEICDKYASEYTNIKVYHKKNGGTSQAKNFGIKKATGTWILFVDSDDYVDSDYISTLMSNTEKDLLNIIICGYQVDYVEEGYNVRVIPPFAKRKYYLKEGVREAIYDLDSYGLLNVAVCKMYRKDILMNNKIFFDVWLTTGEDLVFNCHYFKQINSVCLIENSPYHYVRRNTISLVNKYRKNLIDMVERCNEERYHLYEFYHMNSDKYKVLYGETYIAYMAACIPNMYRNNSSSNFNDKSICIKRIISDEKLNKYGKLCYNKLDALTKLFLLLRKIKSVLVFNLVYSILFILRNNFNGIYRMLRKAMFTKKYGCGNL